MADYEPIDPGVQIKASLSDLVAFRWETTSVEADFIIPDDDRLISIRFDGQCIVRLLDEMPLSTEDTARQTQGWCRSISHIECEMLPSKACSPRLGKRSAAALSITSSSQAGPVWTLSPRPNHRSASSSVREQPTSAMTSSDDLSGIQAAA